MRSELVDNYFTNIMRSSGGPASEVFKEIYKNVMDNRIFNNLKEQLNSMIEDEKSLISIEEFRKMFFTYFKGEYKAGLLYEKVLPFITIRNEKCLCGTVMSTIEVKLLHLLVRVSNTNKCT